MKVAVTGATGFIGKRFISLFCNDFLRIYAGCRSQTSKFDKLENVHTRKFDLANSETISSFTKECNAVVHCAFDNNYQNNLSGLRELIQACRSQGVSRFIHLSSFSVYSQFEIGKLNEKSSYSSNYDPYSFTKRKLEYELTNATSKDLEIIILQPSIVFGLGGNWSKFALNACKVKEFYIPREGGYTCNYVFIDDVAHAIKKSLSVERQIFEETNFFKLLITGQRTTNWKDFYQSHESLISSYGFSSTLNLKPTLTNRLYDDQIFKNLLFKIWFETKFGIGINKVFKSARYIAGKIKEGSTSDRLLQILESPLSNQKKILSSINRIVHKCEFQISINKANQVLNYSPKFDLRKGIETMNQELAQIISKK